MNVKTCEPAILPLQSLRWESFTEVLKEAHQILALYDETLQTTANKEELFSLLMLKEAVASVEGNKSKGSSFEFFHQKDSDQSSQLKNYQSALSQGAKWVETRPFSGAFFCHLHKIIRKDGSASNADIGKWRDRQNWIGPEGCEAADAYYFPPKLDVMRNRLDNLFRYLRFEDKDPLVQLAISFAQFLIIHPYMDGNGRVGRTFIPLFLYKRKVVSYPLVYLSAYFQRNRSAYFEKLYAITTDALWDDWIQFFLRGIIEECESNRKIANTIPEKESPKSSTH